ncbi:hypothetical protein ABZ923_00015 [Streptomyces sp. NPDC046881]|uniref:hypothetical protein n=1 Tax=Streptomyces sp. NPDC046881 TaxID=3155374 RepID=UPI0033FBDD68
MRPVEELTALRHPMPEPGTVIPEACYADACEQVAEQRSNDALALEAAGQELRTDPLLLALDDLKAH